MHVSSVTMVERHLSASGKEAPHLRSVRECHPRVDDVLDRADWRGRHPRTFDNGCLRLARPRRHRDTQKPQRSRPGAAVLEGSTDRDVDSRPPGVRTVICSPLSSRRQISPRPDRTCQNARGVIVPRYRVEMSRRSRLLAPDRSAIFEWFFIEAVSAPLNPTDAFFTTDPETTADTNPLTGRPAPAGLPTSPGPETDNALQGTETVASTHSPAPASSRLTTLGRASLNTSFSGAFASGAWRVLTGSEARA